VFRACELRRLVLGGPDAHAVGQGALDHLGDVHHRDVVAPAVALTASSSMIMQKGQAVETMSAPVDKASSVRSILTRLPMFSSIHMRAPPAPQQNPFSRQRPISTCLRPGMASSTRAGLVEDAIVATEVAGVVIGHRAAVGHARDQAAVRDQVTQKLGVVDHLVVPAETGVLVSSWC
jgi:hypothetical protein